MPGCCGAREKVRYRLTVLSGFLESLCFSGIAYGWASLVFVLKSDGYFADRCVNVTGEGHVLSADCSGQDEQLSQVMSVASFTTNILRFPLGCLFDRFGTRVTRLLAVSLYLSGTLFFALSGKDQSVLLFPALSCVITSGMLFYITNAQVGNLFDAHRSTVINIYTGAFDSSAAVFLIVKLLHGRGVSLQSSFLFLSSCSVIQLFRTLFLMPRGHIPHPLPEKYTYGLSCPRQGRGRGEEEGEKREMRDEVTEKHETNEVLFVERMQDKVQPEPKHGEVDSFWSCVLSWLFVWHLLWVAIIQFSHIFFLATVNPRLNQLANSDQNQVSLYTNAFAITQACGVLFAPCNGLILDRHKKRNLAPGETRQEADFSSFSLSLFLTALQCFLFCVFFSAPLLPLQYITFTLQVINSSFMYGGHQTFISTVFPVCHFGKLTGLTMTMSAMTLLLQFPVLHVIQHQLQGDPLYVNVSVALLSLFTFIHPVHVHLWSRKLGNQRRAKEEVEGK
ncbi:solute carrier family 43 member 3a [Lampris incognitus]|uniref:solute carrier family 43 member 3a n=1 Tax=Lampris incognitus TaxID=2546036 RepID=UPI0024B55609|nr:solute carrier family 43 member 3a [Lampris incognitus]